MRSAAAGAEGRLLRRLVCFLLFIAALSCSAPGEEWPELLGSGRLGVYRGGDVAWSSGAPKVLWRKNVGAGWSSPVIGGGKLLVFHRVGKSETLECLNAETGGAIWKGEYPSTYDDDFGLDDGPRATPTIAGEFAYTLGADGQLSAWGMGDGKRIWSVDTRKEFGAGKGFFGMACSPLVEQNVVIVNTGGKSAGIAGFEKETGRNIWTATKHEASYASPVAMTAANGERRVLVFTREGLVALEPKTGKGLWEFAWRSRQHASVNAATPLVIGQQIFLTASYDVGATVLTYGESKPTPAWQSDDALSNHYATSVHHEGYLYGFHGRQEQGCALRCVELATGKVRWSEEGFGGGTLLVADGRLLILSERGELILATASPAGFKALNRSQVLGFDVRAHGAITNGLYYARDKTRLVCVSLRKD